MATSGGLRLSPAETGRLAAVCADAHRILDLDETQRGVPAEQRLAPRLHGTASLLGRRQHQAETASGRLDTPVGLDPPTTTSLLGLLERAAAGLAAFADRREGGGYLVGPERFREQAATVRAWQADLAGLAERRHDRAGCQRAAGPVQEVER
jgi:hypothetical protein